jgi:hypothetical protein
MPAQFFAKRSVLALQNLAPWNAAWQRRPSLELPEFANGAAERS